MQGSATRLLSDSMTDQGWTWLVFTSHNGSVAEYVPMQATSRNDDRLISIVFSQVLGFLGM